MKKFDFFMDSRNVSEVWPRLYILLCNDQFEYSRVVGRFTSISASEFY